MATNFVGVAIQKVKGVASSLGKYIDPSSNGGNNFWSTPVARGFANVQTGFEKLNQVKRYELPSAPTTWSQPAQVATNLIKAIPESIINIPRNVVVGGSRIGTELGTVLGGQRPLNVQNLIGGVAPMAEGLFDASTMGLFNVGKGLVKQGGKEVLKQGFLKSVGKGALKGAGYGAAGGLTYGTDIQYGKDFDAIEVLKTAIGGAALGGVLGGGLSALGSIKGLLTRTPDVDVQLNNKAATWKTGDTPIKPKGMPKPQWDFQIEFNKKFNRPPYTPVTQSDFNAALKYEADKKIGLQARDINKDINPLDIQPKGVGGVTEGGVKGGTTKDMSGTQSRMGAGTGEVLATKPQQPAQISSTTSPTSASAPIVPPKDVKLLGPGKYEVNTKAQLKAILKKDPNANVRIVLKPGKVINMTDGPVPDRADVAATLPNRVNKFVEDVLGYSTEAPKGGTKQASLYTKILRSGQEKVSRSVESGLGSENALVRKSASTLQNFFRGIGMSPERANASMELRGGIGVANERSYNVMESLYKSLDNDKGSLERINAVLDPELAKTKIKLADLTPVEKQVYGLIREGLDLVHDTSYANGHISTELYLKNKGQYTPRLYDVMEMPPEINKFVTQGKKLNSDLYKQRTATNDWKIENSLNDPVYALGKRLAQVETNTAIKKYTDFLASNSRFVSDVERPGFTKLSDSPAYGALSGKYVLNSAAEDLKGFFFSNQAMQNLYDVFRAYDRMPIRQLQKKLLTVFNPTTNVGNIVSDQVFGFVTGVDPLTLNKNLLELRSNPAKYKQLNDYLMRQGITGTDITRTDFVNKLSQMEDLSLGKKKGMFKTATDKVQSFYGGTDDAYKASALKSLLDKGFSLEEATRKVADGFQNYANVGKFYDLASKTPIIGKPFIKFQGDLIRIIKNGAVNNPLGLITFLGTLWGVSRLSSKLSGESDEDRQTRENRFAAPMIPGLNIPLTWQTPMGEINVARYISPFFANNETTNIASNTIPGVPNIDFKKDVASNIALNVNDPLVSPLIQLAVNRDFRGKPINDPTMTAGQMKYNPTTLTPTEQGVNQAKFLGRAYLPPPVNSAVDVGSVATGGKDMYGRTQTVPQAVARLGGIKVTQYGPEQAQEQRQKDAEYDQYANESIDKQISAVTKQRLQGLITPEQADNRISNLESQKKKVSLEGGASNGLFHYLDNSNGKDTLRTIDVGSVTSMPETSSYEKLLKQNEAYKLTDDILKLKVEEQAAAFAALNISPDDATYYQVANAGNNDLKRAFINDDISKLDSSNRANLINYLISQRKEINGNMVLANGIVDDLYEEKIISDAERDMLKNLKIVDGKPVTKLTGRGKKTTLKKVSLPTSTSKIKAPKIKSMSTLLKGSKLKIKKYKFRRTL
jgi:hypothetical protein